MAAKKTVVNHSDEVVVVSPQDVEEEFTQDLGEIKCRAMMDNAQLYADLPKECKRKCLDELEQTIQTLQKIKRNLGEGGDAESQSSDKKNVVQVLWKSEKSRSFTKQDVINSFQGYGHRPVSHKVPEIISVEFQDNFTLDSKKYLQPLRMCFIKFSTKEEASYALGLNDLIIYVKIDSSSSSTSFPVQFIQPTQTPATHSTLRCIGTLITRLGEIEKEFKNIGAERRIMCGIPTLKPEFMDKAVYMAKLSAFKATRSSGALLDHNAHGLLISRKPVDTEALQALIQPLYNEECDILIQLRECQISGEVDFEFDHAC
jgi:hypothetical protein